MSYGYSGRSNPYDQRGGASGSGYNDQPYNPPYGEGYDSQPYDAAEPVYGSNARYNRAQPAMGRDNYAGANVEMEPLAPNGNSFERQQDPNAILNECKSIAKAVREIEGDRREFETLKGLQQRVLDDPDSSAESINNRELDTMTTNTMAKYRELADRVRAIKAQPEWNSSRNKSQVDNVEHQLRESMQKYQRVESDFRARIRDQMARQYRIVNPNASQAEVEQIVSDTSNQQVFSQALMQSDRRGQSRQALTAVQNRHAAIQKIEAQMIELADLFNFMNEQVVQQEAAVTIIEDKGEEVVTNIQDGNVHLDKGVKSARNTRKWKWYCLLICILIIIIIVVIVIIYIKVINPPKNTKRSLMDAFQTGSVSFEGLAWIPRGRSILPTISFDA